MAMPTLWILLLMHAHGPPDYIETFEHKNFCEIRAEREANVSYKGNNKPQYKCVAYRPTKGP
jgi:hypothetical protein